MRRFTPITALLFLTLIICLSCTVIDRPTVPANQRVSFKYFSHVVRFNGETLGLIARWYTKNEQNADRIAPYNQNLPSTNGALPPNTRILIPRSLLKTEKLMPAEFVVKHADGKFLIMATPPVSFRTGSPSPTPTPTPTITPTSTPTPTPTLTPTPQPTSTPEPTTTPEPTSTPEPTLTVPPTPTKTPTPELEPFDLPQPPQNEPNKQLPFGIIEIPGAVMQDLKDMVPERAGDNQPQQQKRIPRQENLELPTEPPPVSPTFNYQDPPEIEQPLPTISEERRKLLDQLKKESSTRP